MGKLYMGFDAGTQSVKVAVYDEQFRLVTSRSLPTSLTYPQPGWVEMDVNTYLDNCVVCMAETTSELRRLGFDPKDVSAIMGDGIICGIVGIDENADPVTPYINYLDSRTMADVETINAKKLDIWSRETGNPEASPMFPAMFARWFIANSEAFRTKGVKFVHNAPYILMRLAGLKGKDAFIDWGAMSGWGLGYDVQKKCWSEEQLHILGIDPQYMPTIRKPWDIVGGLCEAMSVRTGLPAGIPILAGAGDTMQSMLGSGVFEANQGVALPIWRRCCRNMCDVLRLHLRHRARTFQTRHGSHLQFRHAARHILLLGVRAYGRLVASLVQGPCGSS